MFKQFFEQFHFQHPEWLLALIPAALLLWLMYRPVSQDTPWKKVIDPVLQPLFLSVSHGKSTQWVLGLLGLGWLLAVLAMADPVWQQYPRPVVQSSNAHVIVLDLSRSMEIGDLKPSRLNRARFKINDILQQKEEGQIGLVAFAGDAFTVSPLTRDADTIRALLPSLTPSLMPVQGSRVDLGLLKAGELLKQAGLSQGQILLIADGTDKLDGKLAINAAKQLKAEGYSVSVLGVGTRMGGPIPNATDPQGKPIVVKLDEQNLQAVAKAGHGTYRLIQGSDADINTLLAASDKLTLNQQSSSTVNTDMKSQDWKSQGPLFILLLLPFAALAFRRGWLLSLGLVVIVSAGTGMPKPVMAAEESSVLDQASIPSSASSSSNLANLWQRPDQRAAKALNAGDYETASQLAKDPMRLGSAEYKRGQYEKALHAFSQATGADAAYNKGNALAKLNKLKEAIATYDEALKADPTLKDAQINKQRVEELLKKQQEQQKKQDEQKQNNNQKQDNNKQDQSQSSDKQNSDQNKDQNKDKNDQNQQDQQQAGNEKKQDKNKDGTANQQQDQDQADKDEQQQNAQEKQAQPEASNDENQFAKAKEELEKKKQDEQEKLAQAMQQQAQKEDEGKDKNEQQAKANPAQAQYAKDSDEEKQDDKDKPKSQAEIAAENLNKEEKIAAEQWLRSIPDDPGGLLRRKFKYQYQQRQQREGTGGQRPW